MIRKDKIKGENTMYKKIRDSLLEKFDYWGEYIVDEDVIDLTRYDLKKWLKEETSFKLYRYMSPEYFNIRNIETQTIHLSSNGVMNDIFEGFPETIDEITPKQLNKLNDLAYMVCFSQNNDNILMWSHYAQKHEGICVEYDFKLLKEDPYNILEHLFPVIYKENRFYKRDISSLIDSQTDLSIAVRDGTDYCGKECLDDILPMFLIKSNHWEYENEWRIIYTLKQMYDIDNSELYCQNLNLPCISSVYLGCRIHPEIKKNILEICKRNSVGDRKINVFQTKFPKSGYTVTFEQIY